MAQKSALAAFDDRLDEATHQAIAAFGVTAQQLVDDGLGDLVDSINDEIFTTIYAIGIDVDDLPHARPRALISEPEDAMSEAIERILALYNLTRDHIDVDVLSDVLDPLRSLQPDPAPGL